MHKSRAFRGFGPCPAKVPTGRGLWQNSVFGQKLGSCFGQKFGSCFGPKCDSGFGPKSDSGFGLKPGSCFGAKRVSIFVASFGSCFGLKRESGLRKSCPWKVKNISAAAGVFVVQNWRRAPTGRTQVVLYL